jgi:hypothetical protein
MPAKTQRLYASITNFYAGEALALPDGHCQLNFRVFRVGDAAFIAVPGEVFVEIGLTIKRRLPHLTFVVGIANGYIGYVPTREALRHRRLRSSFIKVPTGRSGCPG